MVQPESGMLAPAATIRKFRIVQTQSDRQVERLVEHYHLNAIQFNDRNVLPGVGRISREQADELAHEHYARFEQRRRTAAELEAEDEAVKQLTETAKKVPGGKQKGGKT